VRTRPWLSKAQFLAKIKHIEDDWLTPVEYLPYIDAVIGDIDLDPCSTHHANNEFLKAKQIYTLKEDGLNVEIPWTGTVYLFPPTYGRCSFNKERGTIRWSLRTGKMSPSHAWFNRLEREWKLRNVAEALFFTTNPELMRTNQNIWNYPICIPKKRCNLVHGKCMKVTLPGHSWGYFIYLPKMEYGFNQVDRFVDVFSHLGKVIY
jgi:hypothetical protein